MKSLGDAALIRAVRIVLVVVVIGGLARWTATRNRAEDTDPAARSRRRDQWGKVIQARFAVSGAFVGVTWLWNATAPIWEHVVRTGILLFVLAPLVRVALRRTRGRDSHGAADHSLVRGVLEAKFALIAVAALCQYVLEIWLAPSTSAFIVGVGLALAICFGGPPLVRRRLAQRLASSPHVAVDPEAPGEPSS